jgi:opacity protein-like surface antigen
MKKLLFALVVVSMTAFTTLKADDGIKVGAGLGYGLDIEELAIQAAGVYSSDLPVDIAADFKYYLVEDPASAWEFNANALYYITDNKGTNFYLLGGLNYTTISVTIPSFFGSSESTVSNSEVGLNIGAGADINLGGFTLMPQAKFTIGGGEQLYLGVFAMFNI